MKIHVSKWKINRDMTKINIHYNSNLHPSHEQWNIKNPKLIYYYKFVFCSTPSLIVYLRMRMSTSKKHSCVRGPLRECRSIRSGASGLPYYCTVLVCISAVIGLLAVCRHNKPKTKNQKTSSVASSVVPPPSRIFSTLPLVQVVSQNDSGNGWLWNAGPLQRVPSRLTRTDLSRPRWVNEVLRSGTGCWCVRCLLITESPKTPHHYRYQI